PNIAGKTIFLNGQPYTVYGVLPADLRGMPGFGIAPEVYLALSRQLLPDLNERHGAAVQLVGRLKPDQSVAEGRAVVNAVVQRMAAANNDRNFGAVEQFSPLTDGQWKEFRSIGAFFSMLLVVVGLVLLIACSNVAGLLLSRAAGRRRELATRLAIGA